MLVQAVGFFWRENHIFWGKGNKAGRLLGVPSNGKTTVPVDFRKQIGIYVLYSGYQVVYVGQAGVGNQTLFSRLKQHRKDDLAGRWDRFSWFGVLKVVGKGPKQKLASRKASFHPTLPVVLNHIEGILIHAVEPNMNSQGGRFGDDVIRYHQIRDPHLGLTEEEMLRALCKSQGIHT